MNNNNSSNNNDDDNNAIVVVNKTRIYLLCIVILLSVSIRYNYNHLSYVETTTTTTTTATTSNEYKELQTIDQQRQQRRPFLLIHIGPSKTGTSAIQKESASIALTTTLQQYDNTIYVGKFADTINKLQYGYQFKQFYNCLSLNYQQQQQQSIINTTTIITKQMGDTCWNTTIQKALNKSKLTNFSTSNNNMPSIIISYEEFSTKSKNSKIGGYHHPKSFITILMKSYLQYYYNYNIIVVTTYRRYIEWIVSTILQSYKQYCLPTLRTKNKITTESWDGPICLPIWDKVRFSQYYNVSNNDYTANNGNHQNIDTTIPIWKQQLSLDNNDRIHIMNYHYSSDITQNLYCTILQDYTPNTCQQIILKNQQQQQQQQQSNNTVDDDNDATATTTSAATAGTGVHNKGTLTHVYDTIVVNAARRNLIDTTTNITRRDARNQLQLYYEHVLNKQFTDLPLLCPPKHELQQLLNKSLLFEELFQHELYPQQTNNNRKSVIIEETKQQHINFFWNDMVYKQRIYCHVDIERLFTNITTYQQLLQRLNQSSTIWEPIEMTPVFTKEEDDDDDDDEEDVVKTTTKETIIINDNDQKQQESLTLSIQSIPEHSIVHLPLLNQSFYYFYDNVDHSDTTTINNNVYMERNYTQEILFPNFITKHTNSSSEYTWYDDDIENNNYNNNKTKKKRRRQRRTMPPKIIPKYLPLPIFVMNMPKSGTKTISEFFNCGMGKNHANHAATFDIHGRQYLAGRCMVNNLWNDQPLVKGCGRFAVYTDNGVMWKEEEENDNIDNTNNTNNDRINNDTTTTTKAVKTNNITKERCFYPSIHGGLDNIVKYYPKATILHLKRNARDWARSSRNWTPHGWKSLLERYDIYCGGFDIGQEHETIKGAYYPPNHNKNDTEWMIWYEQYIERIRDFVFSHRTLTYVESLLDDINGTGTLLESLTGISKSCYGHTHKSKVKGQKEE